MTNEERDKAIRILQWLHDNTYLFRSTEEDVKYATKLAIQELSQESKVEKIIKMRDATPEEQQAIDKYIKSISKPTGVSWGQKCTTCKHYTDADEIHGYTPCGNCGIEQSNYEPKDKAQADGEHISRQAALNSLIDNTHLDGYDLAEALDAIENKEKLPSVTSTQKYGKWIVHPEIETSTPEYLMFYECSECGDKQCFCKSDIHKKHFCNNCGARMVEPQERSDKE